MKHKNTNN